MTLAMKQELTLQKGKKQQRKILNKKDANGLNLKKYNKKKTFNTKQTTIKTMQTRFDIKINLKQMLRDDFKKIVKGK